MWRKPWFIVSVLVVLAVAAAAAVAGGVFYQRYQRNMQALARGEECFAQGDWVAAKSNFGVYLSKYPNDRTVLEKYVDATTKLRSNRAKNVGEAGSALFRIARSAPGDRAVVDRLMALFKAAGQWADLEYQSGYFLANGYPGDMELSYLRALALDHLGVGREDDAVTMYRDLISRDTQHYDVYGNLAMILREQRLNEQAGEVISDLLRRKPEAPLTYVQAVRYRLAEEDLAGAEEAFQRAYELDPASPDVLDAGMRVALVKGEWERALGYGEKAVAADPARADLYLGLVMANQRLGRVDEAIALIKEMDPYVRIDRPDFFLTLAELEVGADRLDAARETLAQFREAYPERTAMLQYLDARLMLAEGNTVNAATKLLTVSEASPGFAPARFYLILAYLKMHQRDRAKTALESFIRNFPEDERAAALYQQYFGAGTTAEGAQAIAQRALEDPSATAAQLTAAAQQLLAQTQSAQGPEEVTADKEVVDLLRAAIERDAQFGPAYAQLANVYIARRDADQADQVIAGAEAAGIAEDALYISRAGVCLLRDDRDGAMALFAKDAAREGFTADNVDVWINAFGVHGDVEGGLEVLRKAIEMNVGGAASMLAIRQVAYCTQYGKYDRALEVVRDIEKQGELPSDAQRALNEEKLRLAEVFIAAQPPRAEAARALLQEVGRAEGTNSRVPFLEARLLLRGDPPDSRAARDKLDQALEMDPADTDVLMSLYGLLMQQGNALAALDYAQRAAERAPQSVEAQMAYARALVEVERNGDAQEILEKLLDQHPGRTDALSLLVRSYSESGRYELAGIMLDRLETNLADQPEQRRAIEVLRAGLDVRLGRGLPEAESRLKSLYAASPDDFGLLRNLAWALARQQKYDEAERVIRAYIESHDDSAQPWVLLGEIALGRSPADTVDASSAFTRALLVDPEFPPAIRGLIDVRVRDQNRPEALALADRYLALRPDDAGVLYWKARLQAQAADTRQEAFDTVSRALEIEGRPESHFLRGTLHLAFGRYEEALQDLRQSTVGGAASSAQMDAALAEAYIGLNDLDMAKSFLESAGSKASDGTVAPEKLEQLREQLKQKDPNG